MHLWWSLCTLYLHACQVRVTVGDSGLYCCICVTSFGRWLTPLCVDSAQALWASFCLRWFHAVYDKLTKKSTTATNLNQFNSTTGVVPAEMVEKGGVCALYLTLHCPHRIDFCIKMDSDVSHFNASLTVRDSHRTVSTDPNVWSERRVEAGNRTDTSACQPIALPLGHSD